MIWIVITSPGHFPGETAEMSRLADAGVDFLHLRKPGWSLEETRRLLDDLEESVLRRVVLHDHHALAREYPVRGVHLNSRNPSAPEGWNGSLSRSCHSFEEAAAATAYCDYALLSPIFDSISKEGYRSCFSHKELSDACRLGIINEKTVALGGVTASRIEYLRDMGFGGVALLGDVWNRVNTSGYASYLQTLNRKIHTQEF